MTTTKTLQELLQTYTLDQIFGTDIDATTKQLLSDHFLYRYACDDDEKFIHFMHRNIKEHLLQYEKYLELEAKEVDPLIIDLKERTKELTGATSSQNAHTGSITRTLEVLNDLTKTESTHITGENNTTGTSEGDSAFSSTDSNTQTNNLAHSESASGKGRNLHSDTPQANVSSSTVGDLDDPITWTYASDLDDNYNQNTTSGTDTGTVSNSGSGSGTGHNETSNTGHTESEQTGSKTITDEGTKTTTESTANTDTNTITGSNSGTEEESLSGRSGHLVSEILGEWRNYIIRTDAFIWLCDELEKCFMSNLLYNEYE